jgi:hypothetical protein
MADPNSPTAPVRVATAERQNLALALRKQGGSYRKIADVLSKRDGISDRYSPDQAYRDVMAGLKRLNEKSLELADEIRRLELERLDDLHAVYWPKAMKGDYHALDRILAMMDKRGRYLDLFKAADTKIDMTVYIRQMAEELGLDPDEAVKEAEKIVSRAR